MSAGGGAFGRPPTSHHPPIRDATTLKYVLYGPGHEKFPSWPMAAATEVPVAIRAPPTGGSQRSKSWTDHTNYPKEQVVPYTRPYMKRSNSSYPQQLKTVLERCEKKNFDSLQYIHTMDRRKSVNSNNYNNTSPPERDIQKRDLSKMSYKSFSKESITPLTQADLEEYTKKFDETSHIQHQKQSSYAQSEGYHSYVSSSDSSSTPFIDSLRRDIDASVTSMSHISSWDAESIVTTRSGSVSSSETLKWHGSLSDMSDVSNSSGTSPRQLIAHSARVQTPQKQNSESVLYMARTATLPDRAISQRTSLAHTLPSRFMQQNNNSVYPSPVPPRKTVAECINIYEGKNIKAIQKKALLSFYERHQDQMKKEQKPTDVPGSFHPNLIRQNSIESALPKRLNPLQLDNQNAKSPIMTCDSPNSIFQGPVIMGPSISLDEWVPERPPKNRHLMMSVSSDMVNKPRRLPSPDLPLPSPPPSTDDDILYKCDDPFPPPPEKTKETPQYLRTTSDGYVQSCDSQTNISYNNNYDKVGLPPQKMRDISIQPYSKSTPGIPRKFINPYIKSTNMKYDVHHKIDKIPSKLIPNHTSIQIECETSQSPQLRQENFINKLSANKMCDMKGQFRAEPLNCKTDYKDSQTAKKTNENENIGFVQKKVEHPHKSSENLNKSFEVTGRYRAEPLNIQSEYIMQCGQFASMKNNEKPVQENILNVNAMLSPKIYRSKSESNQCAFVPSQSPGLNNPFSKSASQNQSIRKVCKPTELMATNMNQHAFGRQDSMSLKEAWIDQTTFSPITNKFSRMSFDKLNENDMPGKDDRPPLPEKKRSLPSIKLNDVEKLNRPPTSPHIIISLPIETENQVAEPQKETVEPEQTATLSTIPMSPAKTSSEPVTNDEIIDTNAIDVTNTNIQEKLNEKVQNANITSDVIEKLVPRKHLPEECKWEYLRTFLLSELAEKHPIRALLSEFDEYDNTACDIVDAFAIDVVSLISEENALDKNEDTDPPPEEQINSIEDTKISEDDNKPNEPKFETINNMTEVENYLQALIAALENQATILEDKMNANENLGLSIVAELEKPHSTHVNRLMTDIGLITSLLSSLMSRFNRIKRSFNDLPSDHHNKATLEAEKDRLTEKLEDARSLKKSIDSSRTKLLTVLNNALEEDLIQKYKSFISTKIKIIIYTRDVKDRIDTTKRIISAFNQEQLGSY